MTDEEITRLIKGIPIVEPLGLSKDTYTLGYFRIHDDYINNDSFITCDSFIVTDEICDIFRAAYELGKNHRIECPFCGEVPSLHVAWPMKNGESAFAIKCQKCGANGPETISNKRSDFFDSMMLHIATAKWNKRVKDES